MKLLIDRVLDITRAACEEEGYDTAGIENLARSYLDTFSRQGYIGLTCREALEQPDYLWCFFFRALKERNGHTGVSPSPVSLLDSSAWMKDYDFCFVNVRATALNPGECGSFLQGIKLLPVIRSRGIHLAPFFDCNFGNVYCVDSLRMPSEDTLDRRLLENGISPDEQVRLFIDAAHAAERVVGFDLEPHTSQFSRVVLEHPELFRWIRLSESRKSMKPPKMTEIMSKEQQTGIVDDVRRIVRDCFEAEGLVSVEPVRADAAAVRRAQGAAIKGLIDKGLWTLPSHTWGGVGLPDFKEYNFKDNYPVFDYRNIEGEDHSGHAFGMLTPYRFYDKLPVNRAPGAGELPEIDEEVLDFFASIFPEVQNRYGFDFVRLDYVDHVFDSTILGLRKEKAAAVMSAAGPGSAGRGHDDGADNRGGAVPEDGGGEGEEKLVSGKSTRDEKWYDRWRDPADLSDEDAASVPISDRAIPCVLERVISKARAEKPWTGAMAERMGMDVLEYGSIGFDVLLGCDILAPVHGEALSGVLMFNRELADAVASGAATATVPWAVDTHDSGNPLFWTKPVSQVIGSQGMLLRQFVARFATAGPARRPKYECMGNQDMSHGLFRCNNERASLEWVGDRNHSRLYHAIEDAYERFGQLLRNGSVPWWIIEDKWGAWAVDTGQGDDGWRGRLVCVVALERRYETLKEAAGDSGASGVPSVLLDVNKDWDRPVREVYEVLLDGSGYERPVPLVNGYCIHTGGLVARGYKLFLVRG